MSALLINRFYQAFAKKDYATMQRCYHEKASFSDPVFQNLSSEEVKGMWEMLLTGSTDLVVQHRDVNVMGNHGSCFWQADYTFTLTKRKVQNHIQASFEFKDGMIWRHSDRFDLWRWSRMAFGITGMLLGWTPFFQNKVRKTARRRLESFMSKKKAAMVS